MKLWSILMTLILIPQLAFASSAEGLKQAIDDYHYALSVEWDQHDQAFLQNQDEQLIARISTLVEEGLTKAEIQHAYPSLATSQLAHELSTLNFSDIDSVKEFAAARKKDYATGASWSGDAVGTGVAILLGVTFVILFISAQVKRENIRNDCLNTYTGPDPGTACAYRAGPMQLMPGT